MSVYNIHGNPITEIYNFAGQKKSNGYSLFGEIVFPDDTPGTKQIKVMTYNPQHFTGLNAQVDMQRAIIESNNPDIIGFQELSLSNSLPSVGESVLTNYNFIKLSNHINYIGMASKYALSDIVIADYSDQDPEDISRWSETRAYMKANINVGGKNITWINTHLCYLTPSVKWAQMKELFDIVKTHEYVILTGDFNSYGLSESSDDYVNMYKQFVDAGYNLANSTPEKGFTKTWSNSTTVNTLEEMVSNTDNIITSSNIDILDVVFDTTKFSYLNGDPVDHIPIIATVRIN